MSRALPTLLVLLLTPPHINAQLRPPDASGRPALARPALERPHACALATDDGLSLAFDDCPALPPGNSARELEVVEYRNGDAPIRAVQVHVGGIVHRDLAARALSWSDPDDDADGLPSMAAETVGAARRAGGRMKVGRVTLRRSSAPATDPATLPWAGGDLDGDGFPLRVVLEDPSGAATTLSFEGCRTDPGPAEGRSDDVTLACDEVRMVAALDANPYARLAARGTERGARVTSLTHHRTPAVGGAAGRPRSGARAEPALRLEASRLTGWSVDLTELERRGVARWTLEVRVERIEG